LYQLVTIKQSEEVVKMSKRAGIFTKLSDVIDAVGTDVARFFYLNRKAEAHLEFDLDIAVKQNDENPVYYIQYAYVRTISILQKIEQDGELIDLLKLLKDTATGGELMEAFVKEIGPEEYAVLKKIISLQEVLSSIATSYQTHILAYYAWELANKFHTYYANNRVIDSTNIPQTKSRLLTVILVKQTLETCLDLLGLSKPEKM
jgi:arginyl-tRNA synthetase